MNGNPAQAKDAIDSGQTGDKVPGFDPAAAPLGTDDEAGGARGAPVDAAPGVPHSTPPNASHPPLAPNGDKPRSPMIGPIVIGVAVALVLGVILVLALNRV